MGSLTWNNLKRSVSAKTFIKDHSLEAFLVRKFNINSKSPLNSDPRLGYLKNAQQ